MFLIISLFACLCVYVCVLGAYPQFLLYNSVKGALYVCTRVRNEFFGTLVKYTISGSTTTVLQTFGGVYGTACNSLAIDTQSSPGPYMWGSSSTGGNGNKGVIWRIKTANF
jgi:hypothetical protein